MPSSLPGRWIQVGHSTGGSGYAVAASAAGVAVAGPADAGPVRLLLVFASYELPADEVAEAVSAVAPGVPVIGCTGTREIGPRVADQPGVAVVGFGGDFDVTTSYAGDFNDDPRRAGEAAATGLLPLPDRPHRLALVLTDTLAGDQQELIRGAYRVLGATVPLVGGVAGDDITVPSQRVAAWQLFDGKVLQDAVVAACLASEAPFGIAVRHGWRVNGEAMMITGSAGNEVYTLDDRPALDMYLRRHQAPPEIETEPGEFGRFALTRPLAIVRRDGVAVRHVLGADPVTRTLSCAAGVPKGAAVWLASGDADSTLAAVDRAAAEAVAALHGASPLALLVFDCVGRRAILGEDGLAQEGQVLRRHAGTAPLAGFYSKGEIARVRGPSGFHNQTIVVCAVA
ncbi:MAG TPA: FIST N-terminal domain-containing protein [Micromonosporaceae bacterium]